MKNALLVTYGGGHVPMVLSLARELRRRDGWTLHVLGLTTARASLEKAGIPCLGYADLVRLPEDREAIALGTELAKENHRDGLGISLEESVAYLGLSYHDLQSRVGNAAARERYRKDGRRAFLPLGPLGRVFDRARPDIVVATTSPRSEEAAMRLARARGIPSVCMIDYVAPEMVRTDFLNPYVVEPDYADRLVVPSEAVRTRLVELGRRDGDVLVTGNPAFDRLGDPSLPERASAWRRERGLDGKKLVVWASQEEPGNEQMPVQVLRTLLDALPAHPDWHVIHRKHPSETFPDVEMPERSGRSDYRDDLATLLSAADVVITCTSTLGWEAVLLDKPLVKACVSQWDRYVPYDTMGVALPALGIAEIPRVVELALAGGPEAVAVAAARSRLPRPGSAAARVADVMERLVGGH